MTKPYRAPFDPHEMPDMPHLDTIHVQRNPNAPRPKMTPEREYILCEEAFGLHARGKTYRQMAALLGISKSAAYSRAQAFMIAEDEQDIDLSPTRRKQIEMAEQAAKETGGQTGGEAEDIGRTTGGQNQQPVAEQHVAPADTRSAQSSQNVGWVLAPTQEKQGTQAVAQVATTEVVGASTHPTSSAVNVVLVMILLAVCQVAQLPQ